MKHIKKIFLASALVFSINTGFAMTCPAPDTIHYTNDHWTFDDIEWRLSYGFPDSWSELSGDPKHISFAETYFDIDDHEVECDYFVGNSHIELRYKKLLDVAAMVEHAETTPGWMLDEGYPYCSGGLVTDCSF